MRPNLTLGLGLGLTVTCTYLTRYWPRPTPVQSIFWTGVFIFASEEELAKHAKSKTYSSERQHGQDSI